MRRVYAHFKEATGEEPSWSPQAFESLEESVRESIRRLEANPFVPRTESIRGFVYEVETGNLHEVER